MSFELAPMTELDAVNELLDAIGESAITSFDETFEDAAQARRVLHLTSRRVQTRGWSFNRDTEYELPANIEGKVPVPRNVLAIDFPNDTSYMLRDGFVYSKDSRTDIIGASVTADITWFRAFEDLPIPAQDYVVAAAAMKFQSDTNSDDASYAFDDREVRRAYAEFLRSEVSTLNLNVNNTPTMQRIVSR